MMGWNQGFTIFESTVIGAYDLGKLDEPLLRVLMESYRGSDIDSGGMEGKKTKDGLDIIKVVLKTFGKEIPVEPDLPPDCNAWSEEEWKANDDYHESLWTAFHKITSEQFDW